MNRMDFLLKISLGKYMYITNNYCLNYKQDFYNFIV